MLSRAATFCVALAILLSVDVAYGQRRAGQYVPARPTTSPYLNLLRDDIGIVPNYHALVRPQQRQQQVNQQQQQTIRQQQRQIQDLNRDVLQIRDPNIRATGTASSFMNYSHFYNNNRSPGRR